MYKKEYEMLFIYDNDDDFTVRIVFHTPLFENRLHYLWYNGDVVSVYINHRKVKHTMTLRSVGETEGYLVDRKNLKLLGYVNTKEDGFYYNHNYYKSIVDLGKYIRNDSELINMLEFKSDHYDLLLKDSKYWLTTIDGNEDYDISGDNTLPNELSNIIQHVPYMIGYDINSLVYVDFMKEVEKEVNRLFANIEYEDI